MKIKLNTELQDRLDQVKHEAQVKADLANQDGRLRAVFSTAPIEQDILEDFEAKLYQASLFLPTLTDPQVITLHNKPALVYYNNDKRRLITWTGHSFKFKGKHLDSPRRLMKAIIEDIMEFTISTQMKKLFGSCPDWVDVFSC